MLRGCRFARSLFGASVAALAVISAPAEAQRVDNIVAFGDSYADDGNAFELAGIDPADTIIYPTGRFTGGTNFNDTLANLLNVPVENFAIGGAGTGNLNTSPPLPGFTFEVNSFLAGGGGVFPTVSGTFDETDLITTSIGGNDARIYQKANPLSTVDAATAAAAVSVTNAEADLDRLVDAGAQNISFLAGNTALLPEIANDPAAQALRNAYSTAYNSGIQSVLAGYAANGVTVNYLDLTTLLQEVAQDPTKFGFTSAGPCAPIIQCLTDANYASQFVFWVDALHPTSHTSALIAQYLAAQLTAPLTLEAPSDMALDTARQFGRTLSFRSDVNGRVAAPGFHAYLTGDGFSRRVGSTDTNDEFKVDGWGVTAGVEAGIGAGLVGAAVNYTRPRVRFGNEASRDTGDSYQIGAYGGIGAGPLFGQAYLGYGKDKHDITRTGVVDPMTSDPDGSHVVAGAKGGYLFPFAGLQAGPVIGLDYAKAKVDDYTETGDPALTLNVSDQTYEALTGNIGLEVRGAASVPGLAGVRPYAQLLLEKDFKGDGRTIFYAQTSAPGIVNSFDYEGRSKHMYGRLNVGGSATVMSGIDVEAGISATAGKKQGNDVAGQVGVRIGF